MSRGMTVQSDVIKAVIFDFDGTLVDTEEHAYQVWCEIYEEYGARLTLDVWVSCIGGGTAPVDPVAHLQEQIGRPVDRGELIARHKAAHASRARVEPLRAGVRDHLERARELGLKIGLASSSPRSWVVEHLELRGILHFFDAIATRDDVRRVKPDPELYLAVMERLGISSGEGVVFEDSRNGLIAAKASGLYCVVVPCGLTRGLDFREADLVSDSHEAIRLDDLIKALENQVSRGDDEGWQARSSIQNR